MNLNEKLAPYRRAMLWVIIVSAAVSVGAVLIGDRDSWTTEEQAAARAAFCQELGSGFRIIDAPEDQVATLNMQLTQKTEADRKELEAHFGLSDEQVSGLFEWARSNTLGANAHRCSEVEQRASN